MYTQEELESKKYGELLKILKSLGVKSGRQKTGKVIELILLAQSSQHNESAVKSPQNECNKENKCSDESKPHRSSLSRSSNASPNASLRSPQESLRRRTSRSQLLTGCKGEVETDGYEKKRVSHSDSGLKTPTRSSTFVLDESENSSRLSEDEALISFNRSGTFTLVSADDDDQAPINSSLVSDKGMDLLCNEVQTVNDIQSLENRDQSPCQSPLKMRKCMRRSLRGQLLESKVTEAHQNYVLTQHSSPRASLPKVEGNVCVDEGTKPLKEAEQKTSGTGDKVSSIPRFVSFARAKKMPNFSRIHETAFKKMESLDEYVERKHARTKSTQERSQQELLSSANKVENKRALKPRNMIEHANDKEMLKLSTSAADSSKKSTYSNVVAPKTPSFASKSVVNGATKRGSPFVVGSIRKLKKTPPPPSPAAVSALPRRIKENVVNETNPMNAWNKSVGDPNTPGSLQRRKSYNPNISKLGSNSRPLSKTYQNPLKIPREEQETVKTWSSAGPKPATGRSRIAVAVASRKETFKQMAKRQPKVKSSTEVRAAEKMFIRGVRTNRRFELQMANRGIQI